MATYTPTSGKVYTSEELVAGDIISAPYSGAVRMVTLPAGSYKLECYGAEGGDGYAGTYTEGETTEEEVEVKIKSSNYTTYFSKSGSKWSVSSTGNWTPSTTSTPGAYILTLTALVAGTYTVTLSGSLSSTSAAIDLYFDSSSRVYRVQSGSTISYSDTKTLAEGDEIEIEADGLTTSDTVKMVITTTTTETSTTEGGWDISRARYGGYGGYSYGTLTLNSATKLYIYAGGQGDYSDSESKGTNSGGFNGGGDGKRRYYDNVYNSSGGGGGASDIRIGQDDLYARVIVAGGGGGAGGDDGSNPRTNKQGGGLTGSSEYSEYQATQTAAGTNGSFGYGADSSSSTSYKYGSGGGGGGWYGGGASSSASKTNDNYLEYNGGGSGYVYTTETATNYPEGCLLNSSYYLTDATTTTSTHTGNGSVQITVLSIGKTIKCYVKTSDTTWSPVSKFYPKINSTTWGTGDTKIYLKTDDTTWTLV